MSMYVCMYVHYYSSMLLLQCTHTVLENISDASKGTTVHINLKAKIINSLDILHNINMYNKLYYNRILITEDLHESNAT